MMVEGDPGLWIDRRPGPAAVGRAALFLDRDGVVVDEVNYLGRVEDVRLLPHVAAAIAAVNARGLPVVLVTNQSGIGRGYFDWPAFAAVQERIDVELRAAGARFDLVLACAHHEAGRPPLDKADHPWRKPNPGMLLQAGTLLGLDLATSHIVGDKMSDLEAGARACLPGGTLVRTGYGSVDAARLDANSAAWSMAGFRASIADDAAEAIADWLARL